VKYIFIGKQKVVLYLKLKENQMKATASALTYKAFVTLTRLNL
jgi:hypothetical protein